MQPQIIFKKNSCTKTIIQNLLIDFELYIIASKYQPYSNSIICWVKGLDNRDRLDRYHRMQGVVTSAIVGHTSPYHISILMDV